MKEAVEELRVKIDALDLSIAIAIHERRSVVEEMRALKAKSGIAFVDPARETVIEARYRQLLPEVPPDRVAALVRAVLDASR